MAAAPGEGGAPRPARGGGWWWRPVAALAVTLVLGYGLLALLPDVREAALRLTSIGPWFLAAGVALEAGSLLCYAALTRTVLPPGDRPAFATVARVDLTTFGASHVLPGGAASAAAVRLHLLNAVGVRRTDALFVTAVEGSGSAVVLNVLLGAALLVSIPVHGGGPLYTAAAAAGSVLLAGAALVVLSLTRGQGRLTRLLRAVAAKIPRLDPDQAEALLVREAERLRALGTDRRRLAMAVLWAAANWLLDAASLWVFLAAAGFRAGPLELFIAFGLANVLAVLPLTPGGLGIVEGVLVPTLVGFGAPAAAALLGVLAWRLVNFWLPIPVAALAWLSLRMGPLRHSGG